MKTTPLLMAILYFSIGALLVFFAIQNVSTSGWNVWSFFIIGFATIDIMIAVRFYEVNRKLKKVKNMKKK